jgi:hypothetical protein
LHEVCSHALMQMKDGWKELLKLQDLLSTTGVPVGEI